MVDVFRVPMDVTFALAGGEPALMAYRRWRNISRDDLAEKSGISKDNSKQLKKATRMSRRRCSKSSQWSSKCLRIS